MWRLGKISASATEDGLYLARILDDPGPFKLPLFPAHYTTSTGAVRGSWCLQVHVASAFSGGVLVSAFSLWVVPGAFCVLRSSSFSLGFFRCFGIFMSGFGGSLARLGWAAWFVRFIYLSCPADPSLSAGAGVILFARLSDFLPSRRPPHSVRGHGLGNRAAKLRHGTVGSSCSFFVSSSRRPPQH